MLRMSVAVLIRLVAGALAEGRIAGHAEVVETGQSQLFKDQEEMLAFLRRACQAEETAASDSALESAAAACVGAHPTPGVGAGQLRPPPGPHQNRRR
jgi:cytochrome c553